MFGPSRMPTFSRSPLGVMTFTEFSPEEALREALTGALHVRTDAGLFMGEGVVAGTLVRRINGASQQIVAN